MPRASATAPTVLTEDQTYELAKLDIKQRPGVLTHGEGRRRVLLKTNQPARSRTLGARIVTGEAYKSFAAKALTSRVLPLRDDVALYSVGAFQTKTLLRAGSATSVGAFQSFDASGIYEATRPLELLDLVRVAAAHGALPRGRGNRPRRETRREVADGDPRRRAEPAEATRRQRRLSQVCST